MSSDLPTITDVARRAGVSTADELISVSVRRWTSETRTVPYSRSSGSALIAPVEPTPEMVSTCLTISCDAPESTFSSGAAEMRHGTFTR